MNNRITAVLSWKWSEGPYIKYISKGFAWLFVWFKFFIPIENFSFVWRSQGLQFLTNTQYSWPLSIEGFLMCHTYCDTGHPFIMVILEDLWHSHLCCPAFGNGAVNTCLTSKVGRGLNSRSQPSVCEANALSDTPPPRFSLEMLLVQHTYFIVFFNHVQKIKGIQKYVAKVFFIVSDYQVVLQNLDEEGRRQMWTINNKN